MLNRRISSYLSIAMVAIVCLIAGCGKDSGGSSNATVLFSDNLESYSSGTWTPSNGWTALMDRGSWTIADDGSKVLQYVAAVGGSDFIYRGQPAWTNITISARVKMSAGSSYVSIARLKDGANFHQLLLYPGNPGSMSLYIAHNGGTSTVGSQPATANLDQFYTLKVVFNGQNIQGYLNDVLVVNYTDTSMDSFNNSGYAAIMTDDDRTTVGRHGTFDDIIVTQP
jgi:hypothetical protein